MLGAKKELFLYALFLSEINLYIYIERERERKKWMDILEKQAWTREEHKFEAT